MYFCVLQNVENANDNRILRLFSYQTVSRVVTETGIGNTKR